LSKKEIFLSIKAIKNCVNKAPSVEKKIDKTSGTVPSKKKKKTDSLIIEVYSNSIEIAIVFLVFFIYKYINIIF
jgi:hypothetical protein